VAFALIEAVDKFASSSKLSYRRFKIEKRRDN
jgi:hypothetical protein